MTGSAAGWYILEVEFPQTVQRGYDSSFEGPFSVLLMPPREHPTEELYAHPWVCLDVIVDDESSVHLTVDEAKGLIAALQQVVAAAAAE